MTLNDTGLTHARKKRAKVSSFPGRDLLVSSPLEKINFRKSRIEPNDCKRAEQRNVNCTLVKYWETFYSYFNIG